MKARVKRMRGGGRQTKKKKAQNVSKSRDNQTGKNWVAPNFGCEKNSLGKTKNVPEHGKEAFLGGKKRRKKGDLCGSS